MDCYTTPRGGEHLSFLSDLPTRIVYVEDHEVTRLGMRQVLQELHPSVDILEASSFSQLSSLESTCQDADIILLDLGLPDVSGPVSISRVRKMFPASAIVILSGNDDPNVAFEAMHQGVAGFIRKTAGAATILHGLRLILSGEILFPRHALNQMGYIPNLAETRSLYNENNIDRDITTRRNSELGDISDASFDECKQLTKRQNEVMRLVALGLGNKDIARSLCISIGTAKNHVAEVLRILNCSNRRELIYKVLAPIQTHS